MVQAGSTNGYYEDMEEPQKPEPAWSAVIRDAVREFAVHIGESSKQLASAAERFAGESLHIIEDVAINARQSAKTSSDMANAAGEAADEARRIAQGIQDAARDAGERLKNESLRLIDERLQAANDAAARAEAALQTSERIKVEVEQRAAEASAAAKQVRAYTERPATSLAEPLSGPGAQQLLERLEADYQLLTRLVQELHARVSGLSGATPTDAPPILTPPSETDPVPPAPESEASSDEDTPLSSLTATPASEPEAPPVPLAVALDDRVLLKITPVPDFDRLLSLDDALGRVIGVRNVTLADYAKEEVTFRVELDAAMTSESLREGLARAAGKRFDVDGASADSLALRLLV
jgi:hypothetical protein